MKVKNLNTKEEQFVERKDMVAVVSKLAAENPVLLPQTEEAEERKE